jgi:hypothetical protein
MRKRNALSGDCFPEAHRGGRRKERSSPQEQRDSVPFGDDIAMTIGNGYSIFPAN